MCKEENELIEEKNEICRVNLQSNTEKAQLHDVDWGITELTCAHIKFYSPSWMTNIEFYKCGEDKVMLCFDVSLCYDKFPEFI